METIANDYDNNDNGNNNNNNNSGDNNDNNLDNDIYSEDVVYVLFNNTNIIFEQQQYLIANYSMTSDDNFELFAFFRDIIIIKMLIKFHRWPRMTNDFKFCL